MLYKLLQLSIIDIILSHQTLVFSQTQSSELFELYKDQLTSHNIKIKNQSLCYTQEKQDFYLGKEIKQNPASVTKLFMTYWSLKELGAHYRFETKLYKIKNDLYLETNGDPYLLSEQLLLLINQITSTKNKSFNTLYVSTNILLDWTHDKEVIRKQLHKLFNTHLWDNEIFQRINESSRPELSKIGKNSGINIKRIVFQDLKLKVAPWWTLKSPPLYRSLKEVNKYSNNFYFDQILNYLGNAKEFNQFIAKDLEISNKDFYFYTGSGLGQNFLHCSHVLKLLAKLASEVPKNQINLNHLLPVAGIDEGTLSNRMKSWPGSSWAKTGSLPKQGHSAIAGITKRSNQYEFFVFLNKTRKIRTIRKIQDTILEEIYRSLGDVINIGYDIDVLDIMRESQVL